MMFSCSHRVLFLLSIVFFVLLNFSLGFSDRSDAFSILGIPNLNPREMLRDIESDEQKQELDQMNNYINRGKPSKGNPSGNETLSKGRTPDQFGAVQDISGFDGLSLEETHGLEGTEERLVQRCRSAANLYVSALM